MHCNLLRICIYELHVLKQDSGQDGLHTVQKQLKCMASKETHCGQCIHSTVTVRVTIPLVY